MSTPTHDAPPPLDRATAAFERVFAAAPTHAATAPGRVNLIGDHTDYNGGLALPISLDAHAAVVLREGPPGRVEVFAADLHALHASQLDPGSIREEGTPAWFAYPAGAAWCALAAMGCDPDAVGLRLAVASSVPIGSGLSSSAAIEVATVTAIESWLGHAFLPVAKAELCQRTEHEFAHTPSGLLDPLASIMGSTDTAVLIDFESLSCTPVPIPGEAVLAIVDSAEPHTNADGKYAGIRAACEAAARAMGVPRLSNASEADLRAHEATLSPEARGAATHVIGEDRRVRGAFVEALAAGRLGDAGGLMQESHRSMSEQLGVCTPGIDALQAATARVEGVLGCRLTGGGFGGFLVCLLDASSAEESVTQIRRVASELIGRPASVRRGSTRRGARPIELET